MTATPTLTSRRACNADARHVLRKPVHERLRCSTVEITADLHGDVSSKLARFALEEGGAQRRELGPLMILAPQLYRDDDVRRRAHARPRDSVSVPFECPRCGFTCGSDSAWQRHVARCTARKASATPVDIGAAEPASSTAGDERHEHGSVLGAQRVAPSAPPQASAVPAQRASLRSSLGVAGPPSRLGAVLDELASGNFGDSKGA